MRPLVVVENPRRWPFELERVEVVSARDYLTDHAWAERRRTAVYNLCRRYSYQSLGYYVSLLAEARGHRPLPSVSTLRSLGEGVLVRLASEELDELIQAGLRPLRSDDFRLGVYFGRNVARRHDRLARALFNLFPVPLFQARFRRDVDGRWRLAAVRPVATGDIPDEHRDFVLREAGTFFARPRRARPRKEFRWELAILWDPDDEQAPSDERAIRRFENAFAAEGIRAEPLTEDDYGHLPEFDALFLRTTTGVEHYTYRFALRAEAHGLVVVDDPESIVRCTNKVYQAELFARHGIPAPPTLVVHEGNMGEIGPRVGFPCVVKKPDGAFSRGMVLLQGPEEVEPHLRTLFGESELVVAQAFTPTSYDWRVGVLGGQVLWCCRYHMAPGHWQIARGEGEGVRYGRVEALEPDGVPHGVLALGMRAAGLVGDGLYGVDIKDVDGRFVVMEVNDNPNVEAGYEDAVAGGALYRGVAGWFRERLEERGGGQAR